MLWIIFYERPPWTRDYALTASLMALVAVGALAMSWPWVSTEVPRAMSIGLNVVQTTIASWLSQLAMSLPHPG